MEQFLDSKNLVSVLSKLGLGIQPERGTIVENIVKYIMVKQKHRSLFAMTLRFEGGTDLGNQYLAQKAQGH